MQLEQERPLSIGDQRIKRLMEQVGMPNSTSLYQAFKQLEMEVRLESGQSSWPDQAVGVKLEAS